MATPNHLNHLQVHLVGSLNCSSKVSFDMGFSTCSFLPLAVDFVPVFVQVVELSPVLPLANDVIAILSLFIFDLSSVGVMSNFIFLARHFLSLCALRSFSNSSLTGVTVGIPLVAWPWYV